VFNDLGQDLFQTLHNGGFGLTQCHLIRHLEHIAQGFGAFPYRPLTAKPSLLTDWIIGLICSPRTSPGKWSMALTRMPVPILVGQAVSTQGQG